jgi:hypothetical protein
LQQRIVPRAFGFRYGQLFFHGVPGSDLNAQLYIDFTEFAGSHLNFGM